jgi:hypothetical protein
MVTRTPALRLALRWLTLALIGGTVACGDDHGRPGSLEEWRAQRSHFDETIWVDERLAQEYEQSLVTLWDALLDADRRGDPAAKVDVLANVALERITIGKPVALEMLDHGIERFRFDESQRNLDGSEWSAFVRELSADGYQLVQSEWHHARFEPPQTDAPARSPIARTGASRSRTERSTS